MIADSSIERLDHVNKYKLQLVGEDGFVWENIVEAPSIGQAVITADKICDELTIERTMRVLVELISS